MPVALSAKFTGWVALPLDNSNLSKEFYATPAVSDPSFEVRFLTSAKFAELQSALAPREETLADFRQRISPLIGEHVVSTRNMGESSAGEAALADLVEDELSELGNQILAHSKLGYAELKKSKLPRSSGAAVSALAAETASAATTSPAP